MDVEKTKVEQEWEQHGGQRKLVCEYHREYADGSELMVREWSDGEIMVSKKGAFTEWFPLRLTLKDMDALIAFWERSHADDHAAKDAKRPSSSSETGAPNWSAPNWSHYILKQSGYGIGGSLGYR